MLYLHHPTLCMPEIHGEMARIHGAEQTPYRSAECDNQEGNTTRVPAVVSIGSYKDGLALPAVLACDVESWTR
jgi:hypothetical protein